MPNSSRPHTRVETRLYRPSEAIAVVIGTRTIANRVGEATSSSSVPSQRSRWSRLLAVVVITDQMPITAAPSPA